jgi:hypothetical protein
MVKYLLLSCWVLTSLFLPQANANDELSYSDCDNKLKSKLKELIQNDKNGILGLQFKITVLKLAKRSVVDGDNTIEDHIKKDYSKLKSFNSTDPTILSDMNKLYSQNSQETVKKVSEHIYALSEKTKTLNYYEKNARLLNEDASAYLLHDQLTNPTSDITSSDVAITWYMQKISHEVALSEGHGSAKANLMNLSNQLARYTGAIKNTDAPNLEAMNKDLKDSESLINNFLIGAVDKIKTNLKECSDNEGNWKGECPLGQELISNSINDLLLELNEIDKKVSLQVGLLVTNPSIETKKELKITTIKIASPQKHDLISLISKPQTTKLERKKNVKTTCDQDEVIENRTHIIGFNPANLSNAKAFIKSLDGILWFMKQKKKKLHGTFAGRDSFDSLDKEFKYSASQVNMCCGGYEKRVKEQTLEITLSRTYEVNFNYGIPFAAAVGIRGAVEFGLGGGGSFTTPHCEQKNCISLDARLHPSLAVFGELGGGLLGVQGGVKWKPKIGVELCPEKRKIDFNLNAGQVVLFYEAKYGWAFTYEDQVEINEYIGIKKSADYKASSTFIF